MRGLPLSRPSSQQPPVLEPLTKGEWFLIAVTVGLFVWLVVTVYTQP
jgi:hypothetical protein